VWQTLKISKNNKNDERGDRGGVLSIFQQLVTKEAECINFSKGKVMTWHNGEGTKTNVILFEKNAPLFTKKLCNCFANISERVSFSYESECSVKL
jgi:hypothetical protein